MTCLNNAIQLMNDYGSRNIPFLFIIDFAMQKPQILRFDEINPQKIMFQIHEVNNIPYYPRDKSFEFVQEIKKYPVDFETYKKAFAFVQKNIRYGNSFLVNLTFPSQISLNCSLEKLFFYSHAPYKLYYQDEFIVFSPEKFIQIRHGKIASFPMKGTIDASQPDAYNKLLNNKKELAEHATIVDLIRNDMSKIAKNVTVEKFRYIDKIHTIEKDLLQMSSKITGDLSNNYKKHIGNLIAELLPAGSISGAPKSKTLKIIEEAENYDRGFYTGIFGYCNKNTLDSGVMIRFIEKQNNQTIYKSGGGITAKSILEDEYQELIDKIYVPITGNNKS